ncbi:MAG: NAD(P)/FAD-dependent oxidoreductase [Ramlibacter sp.]
MTDAARFDTLVIGAGAAGLFCAGVAGQRGLKVLLIDHSEKVAEKVRIAGGGRCNFTNRDLDPRAPHKHFLGDNPQFCRSALARYTPQDFIALVQRYGIPFHEKHKGQLFGDRSSEDFIRMLVAECGAGGVTHWQPCGVKALRVTDGGFEADTDRGPVRSRSVVIATGGLSIPQIGATDFAYRIARQFGLRVVETRPALVPLTFDSQGWAPWSQLSGLSLPVTIETGGKKDRIAFAEDLLFTHRGLSGPGVLQISSYWRPGEPVRIDLAPGADLPDALARAKATSRRLVANELAALLPARLADAWVQQDAAWQRPVSDATDKALSNLAGRLARWELVPTGTEGYKKAEVTAGGVDTRDLSSQTMESKQPGLYFIGEAVDVTGWLGGYNFQWAWASAFACAQAMAAR